MKAPRPRFVLTLEPLPHVDPIRALKATLKRMLRDDKLRCLDIREIPAEAGIEPGDPGKHNGE
jgi:hypothetical protein